MALQADLAQSPNRSMMASKDASPPSSLLPNWPGHELPRASPTTPHRLSLRKAERPKTYQTPYYRKYMLTAFATVTWPPRSTLVITFAKR